MTRTIAITGASGFTGGALARHFHERGARVLAYGRRAAPDLPPDMPYQRWNIADAPITVREPVDTLIHAAAAVGDWGAESHFHEVNVRGTHHVLTSFRDAGQVIHVSSSSVYDPFLSKRMIDESFPYGTRYLNAYGRTKMLAEKVVLAARRPNVVILRPRAIYGAGDTTLLPRLMRARRGRFMIGLGDGSAQTSLTYIENFCHAVEQTMQYQFDETAIFNIADAQAVRVSEIYQALIDAFGWDVHPLWLPRPLAWGAASLLEGFYTMMRRPHAPLLTRYAVALLAQDYTLSIERARQQIRYAPAIDFTTGIALTRRWWLSTRDNRQ